MNVNNYNERFDPVTEFKKAKCFVLRSDNDDDIHKVTKVSINSYLCRVLNIKYGQALQQQTNYSAKRIANKKTVKDYQFFYFLRTLLKFPL